MTLTISFYPCCSHKLNQSHLYKRNSSNTLNLNIYQLRISYHMFKLLLFLKLRIVLNITVIRYKCVNISHWMYFQYASQNISRMYVFLFHSFHIYDLVTPSKSKSNGVMGIC